MAKIRRQRLKELLLLQVITLLSTTTNEAFAQATTLLHNSGSFIQTQASAFKPNHVSVHFEPLAAAEAATTHLQAHNQKQYQLARSSLTSAATTAPVPTSSSSITNNQLVNSQQDYQQIAQSLSLTRQQQQQADSENVIESTTSSIGNTKSGCQLPSTWAGRWYQSNKEPIRVTNTEISDKGLCRDQKGDKYLFEFSNGKPATSSNVAASNSIQQPCLVCLVINERHLNVLQYKESSCQPIPANYYNKSMNNFMSSPSDDDHSLLDSICSDITGDAQLESLFRLDTPSIECPINGQYSFTYDSCHEPQSSLESCIDKKQLNFKFSACPDIPGSESKSEVLKCYADWTEGNNYYMIGRLEYASNQQDKGRFRCFVYEKSLDGKFIQMAQSLEESCYGLINPNEGPKTLRLSVKTPIQNMCHFPSYIENQSENWLSVDNTLIYMFSQNSTKYQVKETKEGNVIEEAACLQQFTHPTQAPHSLHHHQHTRSNNQHQQITAHNRRFANSNYPRNDQSTQQVSSPTKPASTSDVVYLIQITKNCQTTNYCVRFYKRSNGIVQIDYFLSQPGSDNQCRIAFIGAPQTQIITSTNLEYQRCPFEGAYTIDAPIESDLTYNPSNIFICPRQSFLTAQCDHPSRLRIHSRCSPSKFSIKNLYCLGSWSTGGLVSILLADDERQRYSAWYKDYGTLQLPGPEGAPSGEIVSTRSQQLLSLSPAATATVASQSSNLINAQFSPIVDLQIALISARPIVKTMQVRLTRRNQCSELRGYSNLGSFGGAPATPIGSSSSSSMLSYASSASGLQSYIFPPNFVMALIVAVLASLLNNGLIR